MRCFLCRRRAGAAHGVSLAIPAGSSLAIVGAERRPGKTTLIKLLARLYDPSGGAIRIDGVDLRDIEPAAWRGQHGGDLPGLPTLQFLGARQRRVRRRQRWRVTTRRSRRAAEKAGVLDRVRALPKGWDTPLMRQFTDGADLSGGEWQRVALARALMAVEAGARLLILDEPTAALDVRAEAELYDRFLDLTRGLTTILISHRFSTVRRADRICVLDAGKVVELGSHAELVALGGKYAELFTLQSQRFVEAEAG